MLAFLRRLVQQQMCGLHGHDALLQFAGDRMFLRCVSCGHESPGWVLDEAPPKPMPAPAPASGNVVPFPKRVVA